MIVVAKDDVLRGLKRFKRLAKQDLLASGRTSDPAFWEAQAQTRRRTYTQLMETVETHGVEAACEQAMARYAALPHTHAQMVAPLVSGQEQAFEMFFQILGIDQKTRLHLRAERRSRSSVADITVNASSS